MPDHRPLSRLRSLVSSLLILIALPTLALAQSGTIEERSAAPRIDAARMLDDLRYLSADELQGRKTGTPGNARAAEYILSRFREAGLLPLAGSYTQKFSFTNQRDGKEYNGTNVIGYLKGGAEPGRYLVVTAHYDHLGIGKPDERGDSIYNGADDNAAGVAALIALANYLREHPPAHSIIFIAFDAEEFGLKGAEAFVANPPIPLESIILNVNMDMISRNERNELYLAGTHHYPYLEPLVKRVAARSRITLLMGHDTGEVRSEDWTYASDHGAFHRRGIPFLYLGVEDHPDYHRPSDEFSRIQPKFYQAAVETILDLILELDDGPPTPPAD